MSLIIIDVFQILNINLGRLGLLGKIYRKCLRLSLVGCFTKTYKRGSLGNEQKKLDLLVYVLIKMVQSLQICWIFETFFLLIFLEICLKVLYCNRQRGCIIVILLDGTFHKTYKGVPLVVGSQNFYKGEKIISFLKKRKLSLYEFKIFFNFMNVLLIYFKVGYY